MISTTLTNSFTLKYALHDLRKLCQQRNYLVLFALVQNSPNFDAIQK